MLYQYINHLNLGTTKQEYTSEELACKMKAIGLHNTNELHVVLHTHVYHFYAVIKISYPFESFSGFSVKMFKGVQVSSMAADRPGGTHLKFSPKKVLFVWRIASFVI